MSSIQSTKTLVFCTAYAPAEPRQMGRDDPMSYYSWNIRYRIWLEAIKHSSLQFDQILIVDDGSTRLPNWEGVRILRENDDLQCDDPVVFFHFDQRLGRKAVSDFPGWVRSFFFASRFAEANACTRIVHIEADAFLITARAVEMVNSINDGWVSLWSPKFQRPESGVQVIAGRALQTFRDWAERPIGSFSGKIIEKTLPFTHVEKTLIGDHYGENFFNWVPSEADWCSQARPSRLGSYAEYFWWMPWLTSELPELRREVAGSPIMNADSQFGHEGTHYLTFLRRMIDTLAPKMYFEIGTHSGSSLQMVSCDAVCVDPKFAISSNVILNRKNTHFYQGSSDEFFEDQFLVKRLFPWGVDLAFLDGLHLFEALLKDFINTEKLTNPPSVILLHDCLPFNERMAARERIWGGDDEPQEIRDYWTGDVWKLLVILNKYRPDLTVSYLDCPPTGLVACSNLDKFNTTLSDRFSEIVDEFSSLELSDYGFDRLWRLYPTFSSTLLLSDEEPISTEPRKLAVSVSA